ncbi:MAG: imidazole glycerol phosphate synthase subunit HisH, partial [Planctomycetota bacterium]|nr:imidazole glycerol phosphate synthase subunit HisH [Planctomycetota bacterium]
MIAIIDIGSGNIGSVKRTLDYLNIKSRVVSRGEDLNSPDIYRGGIVFPGVGHFGKVMQNLKQRGFSTILPSLLNEGIPYFGICVGLQILFESTEETLTTKSEIPKGWSILKGKVIRFRTGKVPQIGWNALENVKTPWLVNKSYVYFVNSFYAVPVDSNVTVATSFYTCNFTSAIEYNNIKAV